MTQIIEGVRFQVVSGSYFVTEFTSAYDPRRTLRFQHAKIAYRYILDCMNPRGVEHDPNSTKALRFLRAKTER